MDASQMSHSVSGHWGPVTATLDWCEVCMSFQITACLLSLRAARPIISSRVTLRRFPTRFPTSSSFAYPYTAHVRHQESPYRLVISWDSLFVFLCPHPVTLYPNMLITRGSLQGCALIGLGSVFFHATLLYEAQLADELPMVYQASFLLVVLLESEPGFGFKSTYSRLLVAATVLFNILFTAS